MPVPDLPRAEGNQPDACCAGAGGAVPVALWAVCVPAQLRSRQRPYAPDGHRRSDFAAPVGVFPRAMCLDASGRLLLAAGGAVDEAYLRSLMAGSPPEKVTPSIPPRKRKRTGKRLKRQRRNLKRKRCRKRPHPKQLKAAQAEFMRRFLTPYKCEGRQGVYIDKELHQKISVIVGIAGKRQLTVGNYIDNVLREHFEKHSDEVKAYCQKSYNKYFKLWICDYVMKPGGSVLAVVRLSVHGQVPVQGAAWRDMFSGRHAAAWRKALRGAAGWFDPVKEERKKGRGQTKGKNGPERDSGSRENAGERASTCQGGDEAHRKDCGEKQ